MIINKLSLCGGNFDLHVEQSVPFFNLSILIIIHALQKKNQNVYLPNLTQQCITTMEIMRGELLPFLNSVLEILNH